MLNDPRILNRRLDKDVDINAYENRSILTDIDESSIVPHLKSMNRWNEGMSRIQAGEIILKIIKNTYIQKYSYKKFKPLAAR